MLTRLQALQIPFEGHTIQQLTNFRQKVTYALNAVPTEDRPDDRLLGEWLYQRLKPIKLLEHKIRQIRNSSPKSPKRSFPWLWRKLRDVLIEAKEDNNASAVNKWLASGPHAALLAEDFQKDDKDRKAKGAL